MANGGDLPLTSGDIQELSEAIADRDMECVALKFMGMARETVKNIRSDNQRNAEGFNRDVLFKWRNKTQGTAQVGFSFEQLQIISSYQFNIPSEKT